MAGSDSLKNIKYKRWELRKAILKVIILSFLGGGGSYVRPTLPLMIDAIIIYLREEMKIAVEEQKVKRVLESLDEQEIIDLQEKNGEVYVRSIDKHNTMVEKHSIKLLLDFKRKKKKWNGKWFMVFFDVPEIQRNKRDYLREFLIKLGFYRYQKSVYLFPYECEEEVKLIKKIVAGAKYMKYIVAERIEEENLAKTFFHL